jgi:hypothetical protein
MRDYKTRDLYKPFACRFAEVHPRINDMLTYIHLMRRKLYAIVLLPLTIVVLLLTSCMHVRAAVLPIFRGAATASCCSLTAACPRTARALIWQSPRTRRTSRGLPSASPRAPAPLARPDRYATSSFCFCCSSCSQPVARTLYVFCF